MHALLTDTSGRLIKLVPTEFLDRETRLGPKWFSTTEIADILNIPSRTISYWVKESLIEPTGGKGDGKGNHHRYTLHNVIEIAIVHCLSKAGMATEFVEKTMKDLHTIGYFNNLDGKDRSEEIKYIKIVDGEIVTFHKNADEPQKCIGSDILCSFVDLDNLERKIAHIVNRT